MSEPAAEAAQDPKTRPPRTRDARARRRRGRFGLWLLLSLAFLMATGGFAVLALTGKPLRLPVWVVAEAEDRINRAMDASGTGAIALGGVVVIVDQDWVPRIRLEDVRLLQSGGTTVAQFPELRVAFDPAALTEGRIRPRSLRIIGARVTLRRRGDGTFDMAFGDMAGPQVRNFAELLDAVDGVFTLPAFSHLRRIEAEGLTLTLDDRRARRVWQVGDGRITLENRAEELAVEVGFGLVGGGRTPARAVLTFISRKGSPEARISATVDQVAAADIASQSPLLGWLGVLDAPISGTLRTGIDASGKIATLEGTLEIDAGALQPTNATLPIAFDRAGLFFSYDAAQEKITFSDLMVESRSLRVKAKGHSYVQGLAQGGVDIAEVGAKDGGRRPQVAFLAQVQFSEVMVDPEGLFEQPARFTRGALDLRLRLDPFSIEIGQLSLQAAEAGHLQGKGKVTAEPEGWGVALDLAVDTIGHQRLLALWPVTLKPKTRTWLEQNVQEGELFNVKAALRLRPNQEPRLSLGYEFAAADVRFLKTLPPVVDGYGYSTIDANTYTLVLDKGRVTPPLGGDIDVAGTVFRVPDITVKPAPAEVSLKATSTITAALSLLDEPPFEFLTKAGRPVTLGDGWARMTAEIRLPLLPKVRPDQVDYSVAGTLRDVRSEVLVPGRVLTAPQLDLTADRTGLRITGAGLLGAVPFDATFTQGFAPEERGKSRVDATVTLSQAFIDEFGIGLPKGSVDGSGPGQIGIDLERDHPPRFTLLSDLNRIGLQIAALGWSKARNATGRLEVAGTLGTPPQVDRLLVQAPGLSAEGTVTLGADGFERAEFSKVVLGNWLDAPVTLTGRGRGKPLGVALLGGTVNLPRMSLGKGTGGAAAGGPMSVRLDRLIVSQGISLTGFRGDFTPQGGFNGTFTGKVNGAAAVTGTVVPSPKGTAVRVRSEDAGGVFSAAGIFEKGRGGALDLSLLPTGEAGHYSGSVAIKDLRLRNVPVLAEMLNAVSVVGLLDQMNNSGLVFSNVDANFRLTPNAIEIMGGSAVGPSLGLSFAGVYNVVEKVIDMQGVISPIYLVNGIGSILTRKGEGLFGFNYRVYGSAAAPKVTVNPLSILTPGMFREIFRSPAPKVGG